MFLVKHIIGIMCAKNCKNRFTSVQLFWGNCRSFFGHGFVTGNNWALIT